MDFETLRGDIRGRVLTPGDTGFEQAATPWNTTVAQRPAAVVEAATAGDVAAVVRFARAAGRFVVAQPTGHGATGDIENAILLRTGQLNAVSIDAGARVALVGAGANWGQVQAAAAEHGLTGLAGSNPVVGVTGYTLGGGLGWFGRKYGWASNAVRALEIVTAEGEPARVTADSDPELLWALCGGGGDFGVVTALEFDLFPAPGLYGGRVMWPGTHAREVWDLFRQLTSQAPDELSVWFHRFQFPQAPEMVALDVAYLGDPEQGRALVAAIDGLDGAVSDSRAVMSVANLGDITTEPTTPSPSISRAELLTDLDDEVAEALLGAPVAPLLNIQVRHLGGALALPGAGARGPLTEPYAVYLLGLGLPQLRDAVTAKQFALVEALGAHVSGAKPYTFLAPGESAAAAFDADTIERLRILKRKVDADNVIRANFGVL
ncbi:FAD-binding protein [Nocardia sp. SYP-A9097]|uniref:FAD-binding oxidoreductase n=1 Tax=Nocardia sp. SYP-A9097 TaxID=2663237 RepID=UPI00129B8486|nr:FAD-binding protein [Nocardia sp. SYP-A9097]MRH86574.1 FAD-binding protein [Nocardia sp. SYP-A9097]